MKITGIITMLVAMFGAACTKHPTCEFDRNELGPKGADGGQWYWDVYKCSDGTERRMLVAGERG